MEKTEIRFYPPFRGAGLRLVEGRHVRQHTFPLHVHASCSVGLVLRGRRMLQVDGRNLSFSAGECFVLNPFQAHSCCIDGEQPHDYAVLSIPTGSLRRMYGICSTENATPVFSRARLADESFCSDLRQWLDLDRSTADTWLRLENLIAAMVLQHAMPSGARQTDTGNHIVDQTRRRLESDDGQAIHLEELAGSVHISPFYLNRLFRRQVGIPPHNFLLQSRVRRSLELLAQNGSISRTASELGFSDQSHFTRLFKRHVGITPGRYLELNDEHPPHD